MAATPNSAAAAKLPKQYAFLLKESGPRLLLEALKTFGTVETPGPNNNPSIMAWAKATGLDRYYKRDSDAWCGLWMAYVALQAGWEIPANPLGAQNWKGFGQPADVAMLGDVLVFWREKKTSWKGHVGIYVGEDKTHYHVLGGNQRDSVSMARVEKGRLIQARRCRWRINQPANVRTIFLTSAGVTTTNEA